MLTLYIQKNCASCGEALRWLAEHGIAHSVKNLSETAPSVAELRAALQACDGNIRKLFSTSCAAYHHSGIKDLLPTMTKTTAYRLLSHNGNLMKRPLLIGEGQALVGFIPALWQRALCNAAPPAPAAARRRPRG